MAETDVKPVVLVDVPVYASHEFPVWRTERITLISARIIAILVNEVGSYLIEESSGRTCDIRSRSPVFTNHAAAFARYLVRTRNIVGSIFEIDEEKELVFHNRASEADTCGIVEGPAVSKLDITYAVALQLVACKVVVQGECPLVGTALGDSIDGAAGKTRLAYVKRSDVHGHLLQSVQ